MGFREGLCLKFRGYRAGIKGCIGLSGQGACV